MTLKARVKFTYEDYRQLPEDKRYEPNVYYQSPVTNHGVPMTAAESKKRKVLIV